MTSSDDNTSPEAWRFLAKGSPPTLLTDQDGVFESLRVGRWLRVERSGAGWELQIGDVPLAVARDLRGQHCLAHEGSTDRRVALPRISKRWRLITRIGARAVETGNAGALDELVVGAWLHVEQMDRGKWWLRVADARIEAIRIEGKAAVSVERDAYSPEAL